MNAARVPFMVTKRMENELRGLGYSMEAIGRMTPVTANEILEGGIMAKGEEKSDPLKRYLSGLDDDAKSGYRLAMRPVALIEAQITDLLHRMGGQAIPTIEAVMLRRGVPVHETLRALIRLLAEGIVDYDLAMGLVTKAVPPVALWRRWWLRLTNAGSIGPQCVFIAAVVITTCLCIAYVH